MSNQPMSQHSKATSIIRRRTNNYDEDEEDFGMGDNYSNSSNTQFVLQQEQKLEHVGQQRRSSSIKRNLLKSDKNQQISNQHQDGIGSTIDMNFLHDINDECNYLITKFQDDYVSKKQENLSKARNEDSGRKIVETSAQKALNLESTTNVNEKYRVEIQNAKKVIQPLTGKNQPSGRGQHMRFMSKEDDYSNSNIQTLNHHYGSGMLSNTDQSERMKTAEYPTRMYQNKSGFLPAEGNNGRDHIQSSNNDSLSQTAIINKDNRVYEDGSQKVINSNYYENQSHFSIPSDTPSNSIKPQIISHQNTLKQNFDHIQSIVTPDQQNNTNNNKLTFRNDYSLPNDDSNPNQNGDRILSINRQNMDMQEAQIDMQNFQAFEKRIEGTSVDSSRDFSNKQRDQNKNDKQYQNHDQDYQNQSNQVQSTVVIDTYKQNQFKFGLATKVNAAATNVFSSDNEDFKNQNGETQQMQVLSNREKRYLGHNEDEQKLVKSLQSDIRQSIKMHDLQNFHDTESQLHDQEDEEDEEQQYLQDLEELNEDDEYENDQNMPFSDNEQTQQQIQEPQLIEDKRSSAHLPNALIQNQNLNSREGELLFTNNQHIFKNQQDSDDEDRFDHKKFMPLHLNNNNHVPAQIQNQVLSNQPFQLPLDDDNDDDLKNENEPIYPDSNKQKVKQDLENLNDDIVYNRLPKKYFAKEDEEIKDSNQVIQSINKMRQDFMGYISENNIHQKLEEIQNIIEPEKFIQKHFGDENPTQILFEKVINPFNMQTSKQNQNSHQDYNESQGLTAQQQSKQRRQSANSNKKSINENKVKATIIEEDIESSPERIKTKGYMNINQSPQSQGLKDGQKGTKNRSNKESARQLKVKNAKNIIKPPDSSLYTVGQVVPHQGPRLLKMADYFKPNNSSKNYDGLAQSEIMSDSDHQKSKNQFSKLDLHETEEDDLISLNEQEKQNLKQRMEQDILASIDINFLFNKGDSLRFGLIDQQKSYKLMLKIKEVANQQVEQGSKQIDYNQIVKYLQEEDFYEDQERLKQQQQMEVHPNSEPIKTKVATKEPFTHEMWTQVVEFMRKNPKILMQMLPDEADEQIQRNQDQSQAKGKNKVMQQFEDAKRWAKLQSLSKGFLQKRDLLDAIDNQQNYRIPSPPRNIQAKDKKIGNQKYMNKQKNQKGNQEVLKSPQNQAKLQDINSGSDNEINQIENGNNQSRTYQKQFQYNSVSTAKNIYSNPVFNHPDVPNSNSQTPLNGGGGVIGAGIGQINSNRPIHSQQQQRVKSQIKIKKGSVLSTMGDNTTLGTTVTGNVTHMNFYKHQFPIGSQNQTIDDQSYPIEGAGITQMSGKISMFQNYNPNELTQVAAGISSQRRPITASATGNQSYNYNKNIGYMKPILQQRQESFDIATNKSSKISRGNSISKNSNGRRIIQVDNSDFINQSAAYNYNQMPSQIDIVSGQNNLNQSFGGGSVVGQKFAPISLGPSRMTQKFIQKIAPNLKESEMYPNILNKPRGSSISRESQIVFPRRIMSNEYVNNSQQISSLNKRSLGDFQRRAEALNLSSANISSKNNDFGHESAYEQTPQGAFQKFVKPNALNRSQYSRKESNNDLESINSQHQQSQSKKFINPKHFKDQTMQTRIGGVNNRLLVSPQTGLTDPFQHDNLSQVSRQDSEISDKFSKKHLKVPIVDWAYTQLFSKVLVIETEFNKEQDISIYIEKEVDYVIDMMKNKYKDFKRSEIMRPFYLKSLQTIQTLLIEQGLKSVFEKMSQKYKEITIENTMKLLIRCKLAFHSRAMLIDIINQLITYEMKAVEMKQIIDKHSKYRIPESEFSEITNTSQSLFNIGHELLVKIQTLRSVHKQFKVPFIFKKKDYVNYVKSEMNEIKKLISIFKVNMPGGPTEQDDLNKYLNLDNPKNDQENQSSNGNLLNKIEENKNETEEQSYYSTENQNQYTHQDQ